MATIPIEDILHKEFARAVRLHHPLSLLLLVRLDIPLGLPAEQLEVARVSVANSTRAYDTPR